MTRGGPGYTHKRECRCDAIARASIYRSVERIVGQAFGHSAVEVGAGGSGKQRISGCSPGLGGALSPIRNSAGEVVGASALARDISERKQNERALQEAEKKYRDIFEEALEGMCQTTSEGKFQIGRAHV